MATQLTDQQLLELADTQAAPHLRGQGKISERRQDAVVVIYTHYGPGGRQRVTVVIVNLGGTIANVFAD